MPFIKADSSFLDGVFFSADFALNLACLLANGVFANSFDEADADDGLAGVLLGGVLVVGVVLEEIGVLAVGVWGFDKGVVAFCSAFTLAALAALSLLVLVSLGVIFILNAVGLGVGVDDVVEGVDLPPGLDSGCKLLVALVVVVVVLAVSGFVVGALLVGVDEAGLAEAGLGVGLDTPLVSGLAALCVALDGLVVVLGGAVLAVEVVVLAAVDVGGTLGFVAAGFADGAGTDFPAALGVVFDNAKLVGGLGDFLTALTAVLAAAAVATAVVAAAAVIAAISATGIS